MNRIINKRQQASSFVQTISKRKIMATTFHKCSAQKAVSNFSTAVSRQFLHVDKNSNSVRAAIEYDTDENDDIIATQCSCILECVCQGLNRTRPSKELVENSNNERLGYNNDDNVCNNHHRVVITPQSHPKPEDRTHICHDYYTENSITLPPPLPEPKYSFHRRVLPSSLIQLSSPQGKLLFQESLSNKTAEAFFPLSEQFINQSHPAYCGVTSLTMILNAFGIDPNIRWKGGWRWYGSEDMILDSCCIDSERVKRVGISMEEYLSLARCQGLHVEMKRPTSIPNDGDNFVHTEHSTNHERVRTIQDIEKEQYCSVDCFRKDLLTMVKYPPLYEILEDTDNDNNDEKVEKGGFMVVSFERSSLGQTGAGHFSPIAAYHEASDMCLILDVARFKYSPYWVTVSDLYEATLPLDSVTNKNRGWFLNYPCKTSWSGIGERGETEEHNMKGYRGSKTFDEMMRPAEVVPLAEKDGQQTNACPVGKIKVKYCTVGGISH